jgi:hypothetical protein
MTATPAISESRSLSATAFTSAPTASQVDEMAELYYELDEQVEKAKLALKTVQEPLDKVKDEMRELVRQYGSAHAEKSKLLHGINYEVMATFGLNTSIDAAAVERFRLALKKAGKARLLRKLFEKTVRWALNPEYGEIIQRDRLTPKLTALWAVCESKTPKTPTLTVREKSA